MPRIASSGELAAKALITAISVLPDWAPNISKQVFARAFTDPSEEFSRFLSTGLPAGPIEVIAIIP